MSTNNYAQIGDIRAVGYPLSAAQEDAAQALIEQASARLRLIALRYGKDLDALIADEATGEDYALAVKSVIVQAVCRGLDSGSNAGSAALTQGSQTLGAYSVSMTYLNAGQSLYFLRSELRELGLYRGQTYGAIELYTGGADNDNANQ